jgi:hypothetical protein
MGLDWRPMGKPLPGFEDRYQQLFRILQGKEKQSLSIWDNLKGKKGPAREVLLKEWFGLSTPSYETIEAPRVGRDAEADDWLEEEYEKTDKSIPWQEFLRNHQGYYVIELAKELDGVPMYIAMGQDRNVFRGQFLKFCEGVIGAQLLNEAWETKLAKETEQYGQQLMEVADRVAAEQNLGYLKEQRIPPEWEDDDIRCQIHILFAAAKWLLFYGKNGHGYEADF